MGRIVTLGVLVVAMLAFSHLASAQPEEGQYYRIKCVSTKKVLSVEDKGKEEGAAIVQVLPGPKEIQQWKFVKAGDFYKIVNRKTGKALNVANASNEEGAPVIQWDASDPGVNQQWTLEKKDDTYVIKARHSGMVLDVAEESTKRKAALIQYGYKKGQNDNQHFLLEPVKNR